MLICNEVKLRETFEHLIDMDGANCANLYEREYYRNLLFTMFCEFSNPERKSKTISIIFNPYSLFVQWSNYNEQRAYIRLIEDIRKTYNSKLNIFEKLFK